MPKPTAAVTPTETDSSTKSNRIKLVAAVVIVGGTAILLADKVKTRLAKENVEEPAKS